MDETQGVERRGHEGAMEHMKGARGGNGTYGVNEGGTRGQWMKHKGGTKGARGG